MITAHIRSHKHEVWSVQEKRSFMKARHDHRIMAENVLTGHVIHNELVIQERGASNVRARWSATRRAHDHVRSCGIRG